MLRAVLFTHGLASGVSESVPQKSLCKSKSKGKGTGKGKGKGKSKGKGKGKSGSRSWSRSRSRSRVSRTWLVFLTGRRIVGSDWKSDRCAG